MFHAFIVSGQDSAKELAASLLCAGQGDKPCGVCGHCKKSLRGIHPDIETVARERDKSGNTRKNFTIDQIREITAKSIVAPNEAAKRVFIIRDAHLIKPEQQGVLLKLLEEPPDHVAVILETDAPNTLLPTVRSRCRNIRSYREENDDVQETNDLDMQYFASALAGEAETARFSFKLENIERADLADFLRGVSKITADSSRKETADIGLCKAIASAVKKCEEMLEYNVGTPHIAAYLCTQIYIKETE